MGRTLAGYRGFESRPPHPRKGPVDRHHGKGGTLAPGPGSPAGTYTRP